MKKANSTNLTKWGKHICDCKASGLSVLQWCKEQNINTSSYYYWHGHLNKQENQDSTNQHFVGIPLNKPLQGDTTCIKLHYHAFTLEIPTGIPSSTLTDILSVLQNLC